MAVTKPVHARSVLNEISGIRPAYRRLLPVLTASVGELPGRGFHSHTNPGGEASVRRCILRGESAAWLWQALPPANP